MAIQATGLALLDRSVGGLAQGLPCVIAGPSGSGRTTIALQLAALALGEGECVALLCNEPPALVLQQATTLGIDLEQSIAAGRLLLLELDTAVAGTVRSSGLRPLVDALEAEGASVDQFIIDPFTALTSEVLDEPQLREYAREFVECAAGMRIVLTLESERLALQQGLERVLSEVCGSFVHLERDQRGGRALAVAKTRGGVGGMEHLHFEIASEGVVLLDAQPREISAPSPSAGPHPSTLLASAPATPEPAKDRQVILLVDPEEDSRREIAGWLEDRYEVVLAADGFEAMTTLLTHRPDLVILDLIMPRVSGYELLPAFRRGADTIPLLVLSSRMSRPADRLAPLVLGATDVLAKPVERFELAHKVDLLASLAGTVTPRLMEPSDAEALFGTMSNSRLLAEPEFCTRLSRAIDFGSRFGLPSTLVAIEGPTESYVDAFVASADADLRFEDAIARVSKKRALILLIATPTDHSVQVIERLCTRFGDTSRRAGTIRVRHWIASDEQKSDSWRPLFVDLSPIDSPADSPVETKGARESKE